MTSGHWMTFGIFGIMDARRVDNFLQWTKPFHFTATFFRRLILLYHVSTSNLSSVYQWRNQGFWLQNPIERAQAARNVCSFCAFSFDMMRHVPWYPWAPVVRFLSGVRTRTLERSGLFCHSALKSTSLTSAPAPRPPAPLSVRFFDSRSPLHSAPFRSSNFLAPSAPFSAPLTLRSNALVTQNPIQGA